MVWKQARAFKNVWAVSLSRFTSYANFSVFFGTTKVDFFKNGFEGCTNIVRVFLELEHPVTFLDGWLHTFFLEMALPSPSLPLQDWQPWFWKLVLEGVCAVWLNCISLTLSESMTAACYYKSPTSYYKIKLLEIQEFSLKLYKLLFWNSNYIFEPDAATLRWSKVKMREGLANQNFKTRNPKFFCTFFSKIRSGTNF